MTDFLVFIAILPVIEILRFIYMMDKKPESKALLRNLFIGGLAGSVIITLVISALFPAILGQELNDRLSNANSGMDVVIHYFLMVGLVEEFSKWIMIMILSYKSKEFDETYDGIVYATYVSLGFACLENVLYVFAGGFSTGVVRAFISIPGHASFGVLMGLCLGQAKKAELVEKNGSKAFMYLAASLLLPAIVHGAFDTLLSTNKNIYIMIFYAFIIIVNILVVLIVIKVSKKDERLFNEAVAAAPVANVSRCANCGSPEVGTRYCIRCGVKIRE